MNAVHTLRDVLLHEMETGIRSTCLLLQKVKKADWPYRPTDNMRSLKELAYHLIAIPETDLAIMREKKQSDITELEKRYGALQSAEEMTAAMEKGYEQFKSFFTSMPDEEFLTKKTTPFYLETGMTQSRWLTETLTHIFHHRAQLFNYLKQLGYHINMFDLYI